MNDQELMNIWKEYDQKLEKVLFVNQKLTAEVTQMKVKSTLGKSKPIKWVAIALGVPWVIFLFSLCGVGLLSGNFLFAMAFGVIGLIMSIVLVTYIYHLVLMYQIDHSSTVIAVQRKLSKLKVSSLQVTRIAFLQLPFWTMFWLSTEMFRNAPILLIVHSIIFIIFGYGAIWLYQNIKIENMNKKWMKVLFSGIEWDPIVQSMDMLDQIEEYK